NSGLDRAYELLSKSEREQFLMSPVVACNLMYQWTRKDTFEINSWLHLFLTWKGKTKNTVHFTGADFIGENFYRNGTLFYTSPKVHGIVVDLKSGLPDYKAEEEKIIVNKIEESLGFLKEHFPSYFELVTGMIQTIQVSRPKKNNQYDVRSFHKVPGAVYLLNPYFELDAIELAYGIVTQAFRTMLYYVEMCSPLTTDNEKFRETWTLCPWTNKVISGYGLIHECLIRYSLLNFLVYITQKSGCEWASTKLDETVNGFLFNKYLMIGVLHIEDRVEPSVMELIREIHYEVLKRDWESLLDAENRNPASSEEDGIQVFN
ncbi:MAG: hypothetical protein KC493_17345, partial [Bacteriovoracaceae bacterium]|nr:hypothetical protein [Bacteriovoracaceae bacterium]